MDITNNTKNQTTTNKHQEDTDSNTKKTLIK